MHNPVPVTLPESLFPAEKVYYIDEGGLPKLQVLEGVYYHVHFFTSKLAVYLGAYHGGNRMLVVSYNGVASRMDERVWKRCNNEGPGHCFIRDIDGSVSCLDIYRKLLDGLQLDREPLFIADRVPPNVRIFLRTLFPLELCIIPTQLSEITVCLNRLYAEFNLIQKQLRQGDSSDNASLELEELLKQIKATKEVLTSLLRAYHVARVYDVPMCDKAMKG
ncbi:MAG: hypothetical protein ACOCXQ_00505 [Patescibacteria group bacterium]